MSPNPQTTTPDLAVLTVRTRNFGLLDIRQDQIIYLEPGLLGFTQFHRYVLIEHQREFPFLWLQCLDNPELAFVVIDPRYLLADYQPGPYPSILQELGAEHPEDLKILVILTIPPEKPKEMTANLMGPVVVNLKTRQGKQLVTEDPRYHHKHRVMSG